jgi:hypothetical protein
MIGSYQYRTTHLAPEKPAPRSRPLQRPPRRVITPQSPSPAQPALQPETEPGHLSYQSAGRVDDAIDLQERLLTDNERVLGLDHPNSHMIQEG